MTVAANSPRLHDLIAPDAQLEQIASGCVFTEGPVWVAAQSTLYFSDMPGRLPAQVDAPRAASVEVARPSNKGNGMSLDLDGHLLVCEHATSSRHAPRLGRLAHRRSPRTRRARSSTAPTTSSCAPTARSSSPTRRTGAGRASGSSASRSSTSAASTASTPTASCTCSVDDFDKPNGLCFTADEKTLYINDTEPHARSAVLGLGRRLAVAAATVFFTEEGTGAIEDGIPDGMKLDARGNIWVSGPGGVWVDLARGRAPRQDRDARRTSATMLGRRRLEQLFICTSSTVQRIRRRSAPAHAEHEVAVIREKDADAHGQARSRRTAVLVIDLQNDVIHPDGAFAGTGSAAARRVHRTSPQNAARVAARPARRARRSSTCTTSARSAHPTAPTPSRTRASGGTRRGRRADARHVGRRRRTTASRRRTATSSSRSSA